MFSHVMVGVDTRSGGRDAVALARQLMAPGGELTLAHVDDDCAAIFERNVEFGYDAAGHEATTRLLEQECRDAGAGVRLRRLSAASTGEGLHRLAEAQGADLLVVGSSRRGRLGRAMAGSDTRDSLNGASCAVAIAPLGFAAHQRRPRTIGVAYDGSRESEAALAAARDLAARDGAAIRACEVVSLPSYAYASVYAVGWAENITASVADAQVRLALLEGVDGQAVYGITGEELASFSRDVDVLIVGSRGYGPARRLIHGSTSNYLLGHARCALLVLPRAAESGSGEQADAAAAVGAAR
jgi:nucleotide-binding universal stress UspA family protein